ncbi:hypothetical protein HHI36_020655 [Cryptolaemus montrouzieri]|uniref:Uncharacterized protein n=1 Tax=Cryptolaemus montrouzieri TaxID=559131 RepID=A0ABD2NBE1_9CUCU
MFAILDDLVMVSQHLPVYLRCPVRNSKFDPFVKEVTLSEGNAEYAYIKHPDGRESIVSTRHLAPMRKDEKETLPDSTMTDAELSEPQDRITSQENDGSILDGTISESVEAIASIQLIKLLIQKILYSSDEVLDLDELLLILKILNTISLRVGVNVVN